MVDTVSTRLPFSWVDAFTAVPLGGNPCAVVLDADELSAAEMQRVAAEINLSETAFVMKSSVADYRARYFTPTEELPFAGHPTVATAEALLQWDRIALDATGEARLRLELPAGIIPLKLRRDGSRSTVEMSQLAPKFLRQYDPAEVLPIFGLETEDLLSGALIETVSTGTPILMIPLASEEALKKARFADPAAYFALKSRGDFRYPHHFILNGATPAGSTFARSLGTPPNGLEDPFTGSSTGCMAAYLWHRELIEHPSFVAEQGHWLGRPGSAEVEVVGPRERIETIRLRGNAVSIIRGEISV